MTDQTCSACGGTGDRFDRDANDWVTPREDCPECAPATPDLRALSFALADRLADYDNSDGESRPMHTIYLVAAVREFLHHYALNDTPDLAAPPSADDR